MEMNKITWQKLDKDNKKYIKQFKKKINNFSKTPKYILDKNVETLEKRVANFLGVKYCVAVGCGLDALTISLKSLNLEKDSEVIVPSNTFIASVIAIINNNLKPVFCEPNIKSYNIEAEQIEKLITKKTKAIMVVHLYGKSCKMEQIVNLANKYNIKIIEDCAQSFGALNCNKKTGSFGYAGCFSFYPTKNLGGIGDGGMISTNDKNLYEFAKEYRTYGGSNYHYKMLGGNSRMDEIQAIFLLGKLKDIDLLNKKRINNAKLYLKYLDSKKYILPEFEEGHVFHIFNIRTTKRDEIQKYLKRNNVETFIHYPQPLFKQEALKGFCNNYYPIADEISNTNLSLPCSASHTKKEILKIIELLNNYKD